MRKAYGQRLGINGVQSDPYECFHPSKKFRLRVRNAEITKRVYRHVGVEDLITETKKPRKCEAFSLCLAGN